MEKSVIHHFHKYFRTGMYHHLLDRKIHKLTSNGEPTLLNWVHHKKTQAFNQISNVDEYGGWAGTHLNCNYVKFSSDGTIIHLFLIS